MVAVVATAQGGTDAAAILTTRISIVSTVTHVFGSAPGVAVNDTVTTVATIRGIPAVDPSPDTHRVSQCHMNLQTCTAQQWSFEDAHWTATFRRGQAVIHTASGALAGLLAVDVPMSQNNPQMAEFHLIDDDGRTVLQQNGETIASANNNFFHFVGQIHQATTFDNSIYDASFPTWFVYNYDYVVPQDHALINVETFQSGELSFDVNSGSGTFATQREQLNSQVRIPSEAPVRTDHSFTGWNTEKFGTGTAHQPGGSVTIPSSGTVRLFAQWRPNAPAGVRVASGNGSATVRWSAISDVIYYVVSTTDGTVRCVTTTTTCRIGSLRNGASYALQVRALSSSGVSSADSEVARVIPGFTVRTTTHRVRQSPQLTRIITTPSKGAKTWTVRSGSCRIVAGRLVLPATKGSCRVQLAVAESGRYAAMSTTVRITITQ
jgi:uncharacterized repeat protein (TIGR02543 family)